MNPSWRSRSPFQANLTRRRSWWNSSWNTGGKQGPWLMKWPWIFSYINKQFCTMVHAVLLCCQTHFKKTTSGRYVWDLGGWGLPSDSWNSTLFKCPPIYVYVSSQEDDIEGIHIVAFAEEEDPGACRNILPGLSRQQVLFPAVVFAVVSRWFRVLGDPEAGGQRQHSAPWAQHHLDWPWWLSPGEPWALQP